MIGGYIKICRCGRLAPSKIQVPDFENHKDKFCQCEEVVMIGGIRGRKALDHILEHGLTEGMKNNPNYE